MNLPIENPSPKQARNAAALTPLPSNGPQIFAETQAAYLADQQAATYPRFTDDHGDEAA